MLVIDLEDDDDEIKDFIKSINKDDIVQSGLIVIEPIYRFNNPKFNYNLHKDVFIGKLIEVKEGITEKDEGHPQIRTPIVIKVKKVFKGNFSENEYVDVFCPGGIMNLGKYTDIVDNENITTNYSDEELKTKYIEEAYEGITIPEAGKTYIFYSDKTEPFTWVLTDKEGLKEVDPKTGLITGFDGVPVDEKLDEFIKKYFVEDEEMLKAIETGNTETVLKYFE